MVHASRSLSISYFHLRNVQRDHRTKMSRVMKIQHRFSNFFEFIWLADLHIYHFFRNGCSVLSVINGNTKNVLQVIFFINFVSIIRIIVNKLKSVGLVLESPTAFLLIFQLLRSIIILLLNTRSSFFTLCPP